MSKEAQQVHKALQGLANSVTRKMGAAAKGEPEEQLRAPFERFIVNAGKVLGFDVTAKGESPLPDRLGKPDYAVLVGGLIAGYAELKPPGKGARPRRFKGHDKKQWQRFSALPNVMYSDGNEWGLYRNGELVGRVVRLDGDVATDGGTAATKKDAAKLVRLLRDFFTWEPVVPGSAAQLAEVLAPLCRALRDDVQESLEDAQSPLVTLARDWRQLLFPGATDEQFADAYAQTVTYALLLARAEGANTLNVRDAVDELRSEHALLSRALEVLTDPQARKEIDTSLRMLQRVVDRIDPTALQNSQEDPWLYFYEDFLGAYDPKLRKDAGVYYTPRQVVQAQVRLIDDLLANRLGLGLGFAETGVVTLDPGVGTGTYLLGVIDHAMRRVEREEGPGAVTGRASSLAAHIHGFEIMVGPYAVAELRVAQALERHGARLPSDGPIYLTDTMGAPTAKPVAPPLFYKPLAEEHARALKVKESEPVLVCLGNPPYDRHAADDPGKGGWVRRGAEGERAILEDFLEPARKAGHGVHLKNLYNLYVYFWRWALWKVFEHQTARGPGVVSFITAASYLRGAGFSGMREHFRRQCDEVWIIDLGGEGRGTRQSENVFAIQTPVAIAVAVRYGDPDRDSPAVVHYARITGNRDQKLRRLDELQSVADLTWETCPSGWQAPFGPAGFGDFFRWPALVDLFPWQHSGCQLKRTWPIAPTKETLERRWRALLVASDQGKALRETSFRHVNTQCFPLIGPRTKLGPISSLPKDEPVPSITRYAYRSFDRQWIIADARVGDRMRPVLWNIHGDRQVYVCSLLKGALGRGPAVTACIHIPDLHYFSGRGSKDVIPLWRDADASEVNLHPELLEKLSGTLGTPVSAEEFLAYVYALLAHPEYTDRFFQELGAATGADGDGTGPRVPLTTDASLFSRGRELGRHLLQLHTYGEFSRKNGKVPTGKAKCVAPVPDRPDGYPESYEYDAKSETLSVGDGRFSPVAPEVWAYKVSGLHVISSWLGYRMKEPSGRRSSPLDDINPERWPPAYTTELLELLWVLEATVALHPEQEKLLDAVVTGPVLTTDDLGPVPGRLRNEPDWTRAQGGLDL